MTFREPVLGLLSPDFVYVYMKQIETNYPVCRVYHYSPSTDDKFAELDNKWSECFSRLEALIMAKSF